MAAVWMGECVDANPRRVRDSTYWLKQKYSGPSERDDANTHSVAAGAGLEEKWNCKHNLLYDLINFQAR